MNTDIIKAKKLMAYEITKLVHGEAEAIEAQRMSENLFAFGGSDAPEFVVAKNDFANGMGICDLLVLTKLCSSKSEARRMIEGGGISAGGEKVSDFTKIISNNDLKDGSILLKKGKKNFIKVVVK